jgi:hypothetical protein
MNTIDLIAKSILLAILISFFVLLQKDYTALRAKTEVLEKQIDILNRDARTGRHKKL